jgi:DNA-directed RNA polymerase subunit RPC12/RpoP
MRHMADWSWRFGDRDTRVVTNGAHRAAMNILLDCSWCGDEVVFSIDEADDELVCSACNIRIAFAPDPATTFALLYEPARAA